jgi:hypothetical protein
MKISSHVFSNRRSAIAPESEAFRETKRKPGDNSAEESIKIFPPRIAGQLPSLAFFKRDTNVSACIPRSCAIPFTPLEQKVSSVSVLSIAQLPLSGRDVPICSL